MLQHVATVTILTEPADLDGNGNPIKLYNQVIKVLKHHNNMEKKKQSGKSLPIENVISITRSMKSKDFIEKVINRWENWKTMNQDKYDTDHSNIVCSC